MKHIKLFEAFVNEDKSKRNRFLGIFSPGKQVYQRKIKNIDPVSIEELIKYTESNGDEVYTVGNHVYGITKESSKDNQAVWRYSDGVLSFENPEYPSSYDIYIRKIL